MNSKQRKTLKNIFSRPTPKNLLWNDIESLFRAIGCIKKAAAFLARTGLLP